ncbi:hypothetical protein N8K70_14850 [Microbacterium betulae]|uniref:Sugar ABC transporter permease n=1 Tax=Microbacterium betulae TaxID=2981139 RepID=A0AA97FI01_9MICO|nr:hypothetical protein [Microbacterium sp. AB]WOF22655.1 hypothetical protein N8K70_14850 [Microbacterium sp. AB]
MGARRPPMLEGVSSDTTRSIVQYIYEAGIVDYRFGHSAAVSYVFFALIVVVGFTQAAVTRRRKDRP